MRPAVLAATVLGFLVYSGGLWLVLTAHQQTELPLVLGTLPSYGELRRDAAPRRPGRALEAPAAAAAPTP